MRILINVPYFHFYGGVASHYRGLSGYWNEDVEYLHVGKKKSKLGSGKYRIIGDIVKFLNKIFLFRPDVVLLNPSLGKNAIRRDMLFLRIATSLHRKTVVFIHGFDESFLEMPASAANLAASLNTASAVIVLASEFKRKLLEIGVRTPIYLQTTKVDDRLLTTFDISSRDGCVKNILFLSRITEQKGIFIAMDAFKRLKNRYPDISMRVVGDGSALSDAKALVEEEKIDGVVFTGKLDGERLVDEYKNADLYLFPTHREGMPTSVLEAMAFGLPVITRPVGGLVDFFVNGQMGEMIDSFDANDFALAVEKYLKDSVLAKNVSMFNHGYATSHFLASEVAKSMESIFKEVVGV